MYPPPPSQVVPISAHSFVGGDWRYRIVCHAICIGARCESEGFGITRANISCNETFCMSQNKALLFRAGLPSKNYVKLIRAGRGDCDLCAGPFHLRQLQVSIRHHLDELLEGGL